MNLSQPLRVLSLFSGIGAYETALGNIGINHKIIGYCEHNDKTGLCYSLLHNVESSLNLKDVSKINPSELPDFDLLTFSPPCQDISSIGGHAGVARGTRTGLMWGCLDIIRAKKPSYLIMENVKNLMVKYKSSFADYLSELRKIGYECEAEVLNASQHGLPQIRKRLFMVGVRSDLTTRFSWPNPRPLKKFLKDFIDIGEPIVTINKDIAYTIRIGGRKSGVSNRHNWDGYIVNGKEYFLTPKDCMALMGFGSGDYLKLKNAGMSDATILRVSGNSIAVTVLEDIFRSLFIKSESLFV